MAGIPQRRCKLCTYDEHISCAQTMFSKNKLNKGRYYLKAAELIFDSLKKYCYRSNSGVLRICDEHKERWKTIAQNMRTLNEGELARRIDARNRAEHDLNEKKLELLTAEVKFGKTDKTVERLQWTTQNLQVRLSQRQRRVNEFLQDLNKHKYHLKEIK